jgi:hypothetical protein
MFNGKKSMVSPGGPSFTDTGSALASDWVRAMHGKVIYPSLAGEHLSDNPHRYEDFSSLAGRPVYTAAHTALP